ncbi:hypothetical protein L7F22_031396 [Adiantum nelumboides]|nr:hypothetical protein [Adiantum nelumboides]
MKSSSWGAKFSKQDLRMAVTTTADYVTKMNPTIIKAYSTTYPQLDMHSLIFEVTQHAVTNGAIIASACSDCIADIHTESSPADVCNANIYTKNAPATFCNAHIHSKSAPASDNNSGNILTKNAPASVCNAHIHSKSAPASDNNNNGTVVAPHKVDALSEPAHIIVDTAGGNSSSLARGGITDVHCETDANITKIMNVAAGHDAEDNHSQFEHDNGANMQLGEERCDLKTAAMRDGQRNCRNENKHVKQMRAKAAGDEHGQPAVAVGKESLNSIRCSPRISKLRPILTEPPQEPMYTSKCRKQHVNMPIAKTSYSSNDNNTNMAAVLHGWLQGMRETSPPRTTSPKSSSSPFHMNAHVDAATTDEDLELIHRVWMVKHPSALDKFDEIVKAASGKRLAVFLDYDGTLSPIVEDPDNAFMSHQMRAIVKEVANVFPTAIISGRCKEKLHEFVQLPGLYYAGSHGMEIIGPAKLRDSEETRPSHSKADEVVLFQPPKEFTYIIDKVYNVLVEKTKAVLGARVEHNKFCVSVHFRCVKERHWMVLAEQVQQVLQSFPNVRLTQGRKVLEIRPLIAWNKGKALDFLLKALGLNDQNTVFPIYLGDDRSDEDAFKVLNRKKHGLGILVTTSAKETNAVCSLRDPTEVGELLKRLVKWKRRRLNKYL